jgi:hypothetical protein
VEVEGDGVVDERVGHEDHGDADGQRRPRPVGDPALGPFDDLADPPEDDQFGDHDSHVLHPEEIDRMGVEVVQQGQRPHDEFGVVPPERHTQGGAEGIEMTVGDRPPGLGVGGEVPGQREPAVLQGAERDDGHQLQPEEAPGEEADPPGQPLVGRARSIAAVDGPGDRGDDRGLVDEDTDARSFGTCVRSLHRQGIGAPPNPL